MIAGVVSEAEKRRVGALILRRRQVLDLKQPDLAQRVGVSRQTVSKWETGLSYPGRNVGKVEAALGISLTEPDAQLDFDPDDPDEARIASWAFYTIDERQQRIDDLRARKRMARSTAVPRKTA